MNFSLTPRTADTGRDRLSEYSLRQRVGSSFRPFTEADRRSFMGASLVFQEGRKRRGSITSITWDRSIVLVRDENGREVPYSLNDPTVEVLPF